MVHECVECAELDLRFYFSGGVNSGHTSAACSSS